MKPEPREKDVAARLAAVRAVDLVMTGTATSVEAAKQCGVNLVTVWNVRIILQFGSPEQIASMRAGQATIRSMVKEVRKLVPKKSRTHNTPAIPKNILARNDLDAQMWTSLGDAIKNLTSLPRPADVVAMVRRNGQRKELVQSKLLDALNWITEFSDAWTE